MRVVQQAQRLAAPGLQLRHQPLGQRMGVEDAAIEQNRIGQLPSRVLREELRQVPCDRRIGRIGQPQAAQSALAPGGQILQAGQRHEAFDHGLAHLVAAQRGRARLRQQLRSAAQQGHGHGLGRIVGQQLFLGHAAALHQLGEACGGQTLAGRGELRLQPMGQRQVHVVAAQHQVLAHGRACQHGQASSFSGLHADQGQVGGAAAHIHHQHQAAVRQLGRQAFALQHQPVVEGGLGFLQQLHRRQTGQPRGLQRQCARAFVE